MEPTQAKPVDPVVRFFDGDQELTEDEFLTEHPEPSVVGSIARLRSTAASDRCACHGKLTEYHVDGVSEGGITFTIDWCEEEFEWNIQERRARQAAQEPSAEPVEYVIDDARFVGTWKLSTGMTLILQPNGTAVSRLSGTEHLRFRWSVQDNLLTLSGGGPTKTYEVESVQPDRIEVVCEGLNFVWQRQ